MISPNDQTYNEIRNEARETDRSQLEMDVAYYLSSEDVRRRVCEALDAGGLDMPTERLGLSGRARNCVLRAGCMMVCDLILMYPDKFIALRNSGVKTEEELRMAVEDFIRNNSLYLRAYFAGEDVPTLGDVPEERKTEELCVTDPLFCTEEPREILTSEAARGAVIGYYKKKDVLLEELDLSVRSVNGLAREGIFTVSALLENFPEGIGRIRNLGEKSLKEIEEEVCVLVERATRKVSVLDAEPEMLDELIRECVLEAFRGKRFEGLHFDEMRAGCAEAVPDKRIKKVIGGLIAEKELEYVDFRCYRVYPSVFDYIEQTDALSERQKTVLQKRFSGSTLEETAAQFGITRERVRQIEAKATKILHNASGSPLVYDEDYYEYFFSNYYVPKDFRASFMGMKENGWNYLNVMYKKGTAPLESAVDDPKLDVGLRLRIQYYLDKDKILLDGVQVEAKRGAIEDFILMAYCGEEITFEEYGDLVNTVLERNGIDRQSGLYYTEDVKRSRKNKMQDSELLLWKFGSRFRYYDIQSRDYGELLEELDLGQYHDTEISTSKLFRDHPELMEKYDLRDHYELHNLLNKLHAEKLYPGLDMKRMPMLLFGTFDRENMIRETIAVFSPISQKEMIEYLIAEYGYSENTLLMTYLPPFARYLNNGVYDLWTNNEYISSEKRERFLSSLNGDFYPIKELEKRYHTLFPDAVEGELNATALKIMGFRLYSHYALRNHSSLEAYYTEVLTNGPCSLRECMRTYGDSTTFSAVLRNLRGGHEVFLYDSEHLIPFKRMATLGLTKEEIRDFCDSVRAFVDENEFFTIHSLKQKGMKTALDRFGFDDAFTTGILQMEPWLVSQRVFGTLVFKKKDRGGTFSRKDFILEILSETDDVDYDEFLQDIREIYGVEIPADDRSIITGWINDSGTGRYYDSLMNKIYRNKDNYYAEFDD